jgi:hypothetical protein
MTVTEIPPEIHERTGYAAFEDSVRKTRRSARLGDSALNYLTI